MLCNVMSFCFSIPSLEPRLDQAIPLYTPESKRYASITDNVNPSLVISQRLSHDKIAFWNEDVPQMFREQFDRRDRIYKSVTIPLEKSPAPWHYMTLTSNRSTWILASVCICLTALTLALTVGYYRMRREVSRLARQNSMSSGERMLPPMKL